MIKNKIPLAGEIHERLTLGPDFSLSRFISETARTLYE